MSDNEGDSVSKLVILTLGLAALGFFAYLIYKESRNYQIGGIGRKEQVQQSMSLADDNSFQIERRLHQLEIDRMNGMNRSVRTLQPVQTESGEYEQNIDAPPIPRRVVSMNSSSANRQNIGQNNQNIKVPNIKNLSAADQDKMRRLFFDMR